MLLALVGFFLGILAGLVLIGLLALAIVGAAFLWVVWVGLGPDVKRLSKGGPG